MKRPVPLSINNASDATETNAPELSKKSRLGAALPSGSADQEPPPADVNDVDTTRDAPPMEVEEEETTPVDEEVPEEATEEDEWLGEGWLVPKGVVDDAVAAAKAAAAAQWDGKLTKLEAALEKCGEEGAPGSLEMIPKKDLTLKAIEEIININDVEGASYTSLFARREKTSKDKAQKRVRPKLKELIEEVKERKSVELEKAELEAQLSLELAAVEALPDDEPNITAQRSVLVCAYLMSGVNPKVLTTSNDQTSGNVDQLVIATKETGVDLMAQDDGEFFENTKDNKVLRVISTLERALNARPPKEVIDAVVGRIRFKRLAPRTDDAACAALAADVKSRAISFAAQGAESAAKVTAVLPPFPKRDAATLEVRQAENSAWSVAPAAEQANVCWGVQYDSYALGNAAPLQKWPKWLGRPTIVADPLTEMEGVPLTTIKPMDVLAKKLVRGEKVKKGRGDEV